MDPVAQPEPQPLATTPTPAPVPAAPTPTPTLTVADQTPPKKSKKFIIIGVFALLVLLAASVFTLTRSQSVKPEITSTPTSFPTETPDATMNWEEFESQKYGFSFKYPKDWYFSPFNEDEALFGTHTLTNYDTVEIQKYMDHGMIDLEAFRKPIVKVEVSPAERTVEPDEYMVNYLKDSKGQLVESDIKISALTTKEVVYPSTEVGVFDSLREYFVFPETRVLRLGVMYKSPDNTSYSESELKNSVDQILKTLKVN